MARYTGPKARINRRLNTLIYETAGATRALDRRPQPPGMHVRGRRPSNYGQALQEKQKIKHYYGLGERQLRRYFEAVGRKPGNTGELLLLMCERRLDNVVRRVGFTKTRPQARQGVAHGHFRVNGVKVTKPSYLLRPGDIVEVRGRENLKNLYKGVIANATPDALDWVTFDSENLQATVLGLPGPSDISLPVDANRVNEGYAEMTVCVYLPDGRVGFIYGRPAIETNEVMDAGGLRIDVVEPFAHLRVTYEGSVCLLDEPKDMADPRTAFRENPSVNCSPEK